ncbi:MAG TPA: fasciclin domain-containing protein, partial [Anaerolineales bacterium]|nr:fasciclin domain-containing protein [Anaerolineales bacterium]
MKTRYLALSAFVAGALALAACAPAATPAPTAVPTAMIEEPTPAPTEMPELSDIVDTAIADGRFTTLVAAVTAAELVDTLKGPGPFTVFAPTDDAFAALPEGTLDELLLPENKQALTDILLYHVVLAADVVGLNEAETVLGETVSIRVDGDNVFINESRVIITDIMTSNGVIHVIDAVLLPASDMAEEPTQNIVEIAAADGRFTTLVAAVQAAGLAETLSGEGPFTVFAPTDDA